MFRAVCVHNQLLENFCQWCYKDRQARAMFNSFAGSQTASENRKLWERQMDGQELKTGEKKDEGKTRIELLPFDVVEAVARILTTGAQKYESRNWERGIEYGRVYGAAQRHLFKFWNAHLDGKDGVNSEDGRETHLDHAITELMFLSAYEKRGMKNFDDRPGKK